MPLIDVTYTGTEGIVQPATGLTWEPGQTRGIDEAFASASLGVDVAGGSFQRATSVMAAVTPAPESTPVEAMPTETTVPAEPVTEVQP